MSMRTAHANVPVCLLLWSPKIFKTHSTTQFEAAELDFHWPSQRISRGEEINEPLFRCTLINKVPLAKMCIERLRKLPRQMDCSYLRDYTYCLDFWVLRPIQFRHFKNSKEEHIRLER